MEQLLKNTRWLLKHSLCMLWALVPGFGWFGLMFMGKKSRRRQLTRIGTVYGVFSLAGLVMASLSPTLQYLAWSANRSVTALSNLAGDLEQIGIWLFVLTWVVCLIHTAVCSRQYYQYLALNRGQEQPHPLMARFSWWLGRQLWLAWCFFPWTGGLSLCYAGHRMGDPKLSRWGRISIGVSLGFYLLTTAASLYSYTWNRYLTEVAVVVSVLVAMLTLLEALLIREDYLHFRAEEWERDLEKYPQLSKRSWRRSNSLWQLWTCLPYLGGIGVILAGRKCRDRKLSRTGFVFMILSVLAMLFPSVMDIRFGGLAYGFSYEIRQLITLTTDWLLPLLWICIFYYGTRIRWDVLRGRAKSLMGYESEFQRDADLRSRFRQAEEPRESVRETAEERKEPVTRLDIPQVTAAETDTPRLNVNTCTQEQLLQLPGMGIIQAKKAMAHREANGGFRDADEFIDVTQLKPHFAVQVLDRITLEGSPEKVTRQEKTTVRRRIDI